jgi:hypothetical protein
MKNGKILAVIRKFCAMASICALTFAAGYGIGIKQNVQNIVFDVKEKVTSAQKTQGGYRAILSGKWIYIYDESGILCDTVYVYTEYMTEEDKAALSHGVEFENEEEMRAFIDVFE